MMGGVPLKTQFPPSLDNGWSPHGYINQRLQIQFWSPHGYRNQRLQIQFGAPDDERYAAQNMLSLQ